MKCVSVTKKGKATRFQTMGGGWQKLKWHKVWVENLSVKGANTEEGTLLHQSQPPGRRLAIDIIAMRTATRVSRVLERIATSSTKRQRQRAERHRQRAERHTQRAERHR